MARALVWRATLLFFALACLGPAVAWALPQGQAGLAAEVEPPGLLVAKKKKRKKKKKKKKSSAAAEPAPDEVTPSAAPPPAPSDDNAPIMSTRRGPARVDFDDRLIQGQTNKSGAIYIFERKSSELHSMVRRRTSFRDEIFRSIE